MAVTFENYDKKCEGKLQKLKKPLLIALAVILGLIIISGALSSAGLFPGNILNRFAVSSYIEKKYGTLGVEALKFDRYDDNAGHFVYKCKIGGRDCKIGAANFKVKYDGYYHSYCRNTYFEKITEKYLSDKLNILWAEKYADYSAEWETSIIIPLEDDTFPKDTIEGESIDDLPAKACKTYGGSLSFTLNIHGEKITMDEYPAVVYRAVNILQKELDNRPEKLQVFYYRADASGDDVMQFESTIQTFQFNYNENGILNASDLHKYVEVPEDIQKKAVIYYTVKKTVIVVIFGTAAALSILWCVRAYRKHKRYNMTKE